jgi:hypothetical protein
MREITIGRSRENEIVIDDASVSRRHATLYINNNGYSITDHNSTNGTYVNGNRIHGSVSIQTNDIIKIGNSILPWRNYISGPIKAEVKVHTNPLLSNFKSPIQKSLKSKNSSITTALITTISLIIVVVIFSSIKKSDTKKIIGNWECIDNCYDIDEMEFEEDHNDKDVKCRLKRDESIKGTWTIDEENKRLTLSFDETTVYNYKFKKSKLYLRRVEGKGELSEKEIEFKLDK